MSSFRKYSAKISFGLVLFFCFTSACKHPESKLKKYGAVLENVVVSDSGAFRGYSLGEEFDSVKATEKEQPTEIADDYLYYEYKLDSANSYNVTYTFEDGSLREIQSDIYIKNPAAADSVFDSFKRFFDDHYGASQTHEDYTIWTVKSEKYGTVRINLSDESADFKVPDSPGKISVWIYPDVN